MRLMEFKEFNEAAVKNKVNRLGLTEECGVDPRTSQHT